MGDTASRAGEKGKFLAIARIVKPQGRRGEVAAEILTDFPARFQELRHVFLEPAGAGRPEPAEVEQAWAHKGRIILKFAGVEGIARANALRGRYVLIPKEQRVALPDHHYFLWELEGCEVTVERQEGEIVIGTVTGVEHTGGVDLLHVARNHGASLLVPFAQEICRRIDVECKRIVIDPPPDLLSLNEVGEGKDALGEKIH